MFANGPHGEKLLDKVCPRCEGRLPYTAGEQTDCIIGLVGAKFSGKSHFVATLLDRLEGPVGKAFDASLLHIDDATVTRRMRKFQEPLRVMLEQRNLFRELELAMVFFEISGVKLAKVQR